MALYTIISNRVQYAPIVGFSPEKQQAALNDLAQTVTRFMADGWRPLGGVEVNRYEGAFSVFQAMIKD